MATSHDEDSYKIFPSQKVMALVTVTLTSMITIVCKHF